MSKKKKRKIISKILTFILLLITITFGIMFIKLNVLPMNYLIIILGVIALLDFLTIFLLFRKKKAKRSIGIVLSIILIVLLATGSFYLFTTLDFMDNMNDNTNYKTKSYNLIVLKNSSYKKLKDLDGQIIGVSSIDTDENITSVIKKLNKKIDYSKSEYEDDSLMVSALINRNIESFLINDAKYEILKEEMPEYTNNLRVLDTISINIKVKELKKGVDVTEKPFSVYISGVDSYGKINSVGRSDVNIVATVNPKTNQINLTSIPRDYYVQLHGKTGYKDKLTHAGIYGVETSMQTIEDLLGIEINYYAKVNFSSLVNIVDELGGITINNDYNFTAIDGTHFSKGNITLDGKQALSYVRERKSFKGGDRVRGEHQQLVLQAIINKAMSPAIITKYSSLLSALDGKFITNMSENDISKLVKKQLKDNSSWNYSNINLDGSDSHNYTYSYKSSKLYVMEPNQESVNNAKDELQRIIKGTTN